MKVQAYIHSLKDREHDRNVLGEAEIIGCIGNNLYLAEYNGDWCFSVDNTCGNTFYKVAGATDTVEQVSQ
ncbi:MAG: hypothetical protein K2O18_00930 [Oscillospiraceae bacterium]|nr:hypothetical protein [Oscillospiraceae bacterium]